MSARDPAPDLSPGLLILHGNQLELLAQAVFAWLGRAPLAPLEEEVFLVQSNGTAEWLKQRLALEQGVCAAVRTELPARFVWRAYRAALGAACVPSPSPLDKAALRWRLMTLLPELPDDEVFAPLKRWLAGDPFGSGDGQADRHWQLAGAVADVLDQYQVYRADWLDDWARGEACLRDATGHPKPLPADQSWQAALWREVLASLAPEQREAARSAVHERFVGALAAGVEPARPLPRRVVVFGLTHMPAQTLQALIALSQRCQVLVAVPNPCRWHWADIIDGREWFAAVHRRQPMRPVAGHAGGSDGQAHVPPPLHAAHLEAHPLLAAWGRQGRDFMRLLDRFDTRLPRVDLFALPPLDSLLHQVQAAITDLRPLAEHPRSQGEATVVPDDRSIVFHAAHSPQREVEVLHEQLLHAFAHPPPGGPLAPRDVVVMVPDLAPFEAAIHAVFGQYGLGDARHIPYTVADVTPRGREPLLVALEWLLQAPQPRCTASELRDLLDVPALARRFGIDDADRPLLARWMAGAGLRWGLDVEHRTLLGLGEAGDLNTWAFGLRRMLLGYAVGARQAGALVEPRWNDTDPYDEVGGLDAAAAGALAELVHALARWWDDARQPRTPVAWAERLRALLAQLFSARDDAERLALAALDDALVRWLEACDAGGFVQSLPLAVVRQAWLDGLAEPTLSQRFAGGGVTFCTLLPMRAIPFDMVCLLGMNEEDYPRRLPRQDIDLMALPGQRRAGDRAAHDDDRCLLLEALLSARRRLYVSWVGRSVRDNTPQPPSPLIGELRDYLDAGFTDGVDEPVTARLTVTHPLQPFSRRCFEPGAAARGLVSYSHEWRAAHAPVHAEPGEPAGFDVQPLMPLTLARLADFLKQPVRHHYRWRLGVRFGDLSAGLLDDEPFGIDALSETRLLQSLLDASDNDEPLPAAAASLARQGLLPLGAAGQAGQARLLTLAGPMEAARTALREAHPEPAAPLLMRIEHDGLVLDDQLDGLRGTADGPRWRLDVRTGRLAVKTKARGQPKVQAHKLIDVWVAALAAAASGQALCGTVIGADVVVHWQAPSQAEAMLRALLQAWQEGMQRPLPVAARSALAFVAADEDRRWDAFETAYDGDEQTARAERDDPCLARHWPDAESLRETGEFEAWAEALYAPMQTWLASDAVTVEPLAGAALDEGGDD